MELNPLCSNVFGFHKFGFLNLIGLESSIFNCVGARIWQAGLCRCSNTVFGSIGNQIHRIVRAESRRGTGLV